jgi:hypothetical protein
VALNTNPYLVPRLEKELSYTSPLFVFMVCSRVYLNFLARYEKYYASLRQGAY